jgi:CHASE2 domain-containing sensor protein
MTEASHHNRSLPRRLGMGFLTLTTMIVALISALPVVLLFFITAVPPLLAAVLLLLDSARQRNTSRCWTRRTRS